MAYDEGLAQRLREHFADRPDVDVKKMFGGLCFMVSNHMCCGIVDDTLMARVGPGNYARCLGRPYAREMDFTGRAMKGIIYVAADGLESDADLADWLAICTKFVESLPPRKLK